MKPLEVEPVECDYPTALGSRVSRHFLVRKQKRHAQLVSSLSFSRICRSISARCVAT